MENSSAECMKQGKKQQTLTKEEDQENMVNRYKANCSICTLMGGD